MGKKSVLVSLNEDDSLVEKVHQSLLENGHKIKLGSINKDYFSDGETSPDFNDSVRGRRVFILSSPNTTDKIFQLYLLIDAARRAGAKAIIPILPYFPYARQDKKDQARGPIGAKVVASQLENLGATTVVTFDLHADQIQGFFEIPVIHMDGKFLFAPVVKEMGLDNAVLVSPDAGGGKRVKHLRDLILKKYDIDLPMVVMDKTREKANVVGKMFVIGDVKGKHAIIVDDMCDTAGTLCKGAEVLLVEGALSVKAIVTHPVLSGPAYKNLEESVIEQFICSDTLPITQFVPKTVGTIILDKIKVVSVYHQIMLAILSVDKSKSIEHLKENEHYI